MPLTAGLVVAAAFCAVVALGCGNVLIAAGRQAGAVRAAYHLLVAAQAAWAGGVALAAVFALTADPRGHRLALAVVLDAGYLLSTGLLVAGLLLLPGFAANHRTRLRRLLDGLILAGCAFFVGWVLLVEPLHDGAPATSVSARCLVIAVPTLVALTALGVLLVMGQTAAPGGRAAPVAAASAGLAAVTGVGLAVAAMYAPTVTVAAVAAYAAAQAWVTVTTRRPLLVPLPERLTAGVAASVVPVVTAIVACLVRIVVIGPLDTTSVVTATGIGATVVTQQALARLDLRRYADRLRDSEAHFRTMAHTDALTSLANRRQLLKMLHEQAVGGPACVLLAIDLDGFKNINDIRGHDVGDAVLVEVAERLRTNLRPGDLAARLGGDEFAALMWAGPTEAITVADRLLTVLARPYEVPTGTAFLSASIGLAACDTATDVQTLLRNADLALRYAKQLGKHRVERYDQAYEQLLRRQSELEHELRGAVERDELMLAYQPIVALPDGRVAGVEALLRWHHPRLGTVAPDEFIPVAEESGLIHQLGAFVLHQACHQLGRWLSDGHELYLAVNVSVRELHIPEYTTQLADVLRQHRLAPERLVVEVTESAVAQDVAQLISRLAALQALGVRVALDDFGSGYSSLGQLRTLPVDILKIDRSLLAPPAQAAARFAPPLVDVVVRLGNRLGLDVVAEGITEPGQRRVLEEAGCRYAQGDLFGRAMPAERVEPLLGAHLFLPPTPPAPPERPLPTRSVQNVRSVDSAHEMRQS
jgi:diguanylate cyclase (GGDEF)-like protein